MDWAADDKKKKKKIEKKLGMLIEKGWREGRQCVHTVRSQQSNSNWFLINFRHIFLNSGEMHAEFLSIV